jgi:hypothetical protein
MQKTYLLHLKQDNNMKTNVTHYSLSGLLPPDQALALNQETRTLSLLTDGPELIIEQRFSANEMSMLIPLLGSFPYYCPYETLLSHISSNTVTTSSIARCRQRLQEAQDRGTWPQELRPIRRALSSLRGKLNRFNLTISNVRERGCSLTNLKSPSLLA